jgi:regulator of replication initiation timing
VAVCAFLYVLWLDGQLKDARAEATELRRQLAKVVDEREHLRLSYLRARYGRGRVQ